MSREREQAVTAGFRERFGRDPDGLFVAPGRVNLIGEHTDYNAGLVLPFAIQQFAVVAAGRRSDDVVSGWSAQRGDGGSVRIRQGSAPAVSGWLAYAAGVVWALQDVAPGGGLDLLVDSDVPAGAGLSSSAALECAVALAVSELSGAAVDGMTLARAAQRAEHEVVGAPVGIMDQAVSLLAEADTALFLDCRTLQTRHVPFEPAADGLTLLVIDTHVHHAHATGGYAERRRECEAAASLLGVEALRDASVEKLGGLPPVLRARARHVVTENARVLQAVVALERGAAAEIGPLLLQSHASLRDDFAVSVAELDTAVDATVRAGALGARMTGGGFGGSAIALVRTGDRPAVTAAVMDAFTVAGFRPPSVFAVQPSAGARREELA